MTTETTTPAVDARAQLEASRKESQASIPELERAVKSATDAIRSVAREGSPAQIVEASGALSKAQRNLEGAQSDIDKYGRGIRAIDLQAKREKVVGAIAPKGKSLGDALTSGKGSWDSFPFAVVLTGTVAAESLPSDLQSILAEHDVKSLSVKIDEGERLIDVKPAGLPAARTPRKGNGGFSKRLYATPSGELSQTDVFKAYALEAGVTQERYDAVLADPSNQGISHRGKAVASKLGFEEVTPA